MLQPGGVELGGEAAADLQRRCRPQRGRIRRAARHGAGHGDERGRNDGREELTPPRDRRLRPRRAASAAAGRGGASGSASSRPASRSSSAGSAGSFVTIVFDSGSGPDSTTVACTIGMSHGPVVSAASASSGGGDLVEMPARALRRRGPLGEDDERPGRDHHEHDPLGGEVGETGEERDQEQEQPLEHEPRHREAARERRRHGSDPVGRRVSAGLGRPVLVVEAHGRGADRSARSDCSSARSSPATASSSRTRSAKALNASSTRDGSYPRPPGADRPSGAACSSL